MKKIWLSLNLTVAYALSFLIVVSGLVALRSLTAITQISLLAVKTSGITFDTATTDQSIELLNETLPANAISITGFDIDLATSSGSATITGFTADKSVKVIRSDQLHIKDMYLRPGARAILTYEGGIVGVVLLGEQNCCWGRIGAGAAVFVADTGGEPVKAENLAPSEPNLKLQCKNPPCSITIRLRGNTVERVVEDWKAQVVSFARPGTDQLNPPTSESAIIGGSIVISSTDLLRSQFELRRIDLAPGDQLLPSYDGTAELNIDIREGALLINGALQGQSSLLLRKTNGEAHEILPSVLEVIVREPWRPQIVTFVMAAVPALVGFGVRQRWWRDVKRGAKK